MEVSWINVKIDSPLWASMFQRSCAAGSMPRVLQIPTELTANLTMLVSDPKPCYLNLIPDTDFFHERDPVPLIVLKPPWRYRPS